MGSQNEGAENTVPIVCGRCGRSFKVNSEYDKHVDEDHKPQGAKKWLLCQIVIEHKSSYFVITSRSILSSNNIALQSFIGIMFRIVILSLV